MKHEFLFDKSPFANCHAPTILALEDTILVAFFAGECEGSSDVGIWLSIKEKNTWIPPQLVAKDHFPCWNPVLCEYPTGTIKLFFKVGSNCANWWGMMCESQDKGKTWSTPQKLPEGFWGPIKNKPIAVNNKLLCPSSTEYDGWRVHMEFFDGQNWQKTPTLNEKKDFAAIQPTILHHKDKLQILCRSRNNSITTAYSYDHGKSWSKMHNTNLPNPNSGIDAVNLQNGKFLLVYNPTTTKPGCWGGPRYPLHLAISENGKDWRDIYTLESEKGEFSYPAIIASQNTIHIVYTWKRINIRYCQFTLQDLTTKH